MAIEDLLKIIASEKRLHLGLREVKKNLKSLKLVVYSKDLTEEERKGFAAEGITVLEFGGSPNQLGRSIGRDHPVKALGLRNLSERAEAEMKKVNQGV
ncbi:MAG: ribosomal L7Ae/L30e/S12e/Gadd45 family protein [Nitrososphaerota archaeon]|nr:ribosomal L7Ae/L30e/S12e/Gadd45 family protein [Nitrososphaerota archaeon]MDG6927765.1 ribosomal L7Ae/L30e/S12e/Gadd45 family protein [Nitrososphaerota archaeon]MDG6930304.1 ribosomal L7Ae/L30e/S12e/Gadd45 family protein [Nitrososphaerota archaeon]MDG6932727.1 ribosomal L7Ae/L30e/S12e/Gadd45 family protein [Nitrososphaerota archaeon]MDG6935350.1 ribosomal L7Ae/L30e/S12e/Gadd45 family protein [Nitrososphaerota archaeon]